MALLLEDVNSKCREYCACASQGFDGCVWLFLCVTVEFRLPPWSEGLARMVPVLRCQNNFAK